MALLIKVKPNEDILIGNDIRVAIISASTQTVRIEAPKNLKITRSFFNKNVAQSEHDQENATLCEDKIGDKV